MNGIAALLMIAAPAASHTPTAANLAGLYEIRQMEMAGGLELKRNGRFRYAFSYGALDEEGAGTWRFDGKAVHLTSSPMPHEPDFVLVSDVPQPACELSISVDWGKLNWSSPPDVLVTYQGSPKELHFLQSDEAGKVQLQNCAVTSVRPIVPMYDVPGSPLKVVPGKGHRLSVRFQPNDIGKVAFRDEPLVLDGQGLVWERYDATIRFIRARH